MCQPRGTLGPALGSVRLRFLKSGLPLKFTELSRGAARFDDKFNNPPSFRSSSLAPHFAPSLPLCSAAGFGRWGALLSRRSRWSTELSRGAARFDDKFKSYTSARDEMS